MEIAEPNDDFTNSMSPAEKTSGGMGSVVRVKEEMPVVLTHESGSAFTGLGQESTRRCAEPSSAIAMVRKAGETMAVGAGSNGVHSIDGFVDASGDRAARMIAFCWSSRSGSG